MLLAFICVLLFISTVCLSILLVRFVKRCLQMEEMLNVIDDQTGELIAYCETLKAKSVIYHSPEVLQFHRLVIAMSRPLDALRPKVAEMIGKGSIDG